ncbi:PspA/IM30 family protein [Thiogranum longum]
MALITRVSRLFRADLHAVLDRIEEPDVLLKQAVREMEEELARDEQRVRLLSHEQDQLSARRDEIDQSLDEIDEELDLCFASGKDDLARTLVKRKLETQRFRKQLLRRRGTLEESLNALNARLNENRVQLDSMRQKAELLAEDRTSDQPGDSWSTLDAAVRDEDVEVAFLREKSRRNRQ